MCIKTSNYIGRLPKKKKKKEEEEGFMEFNYLNASYSFLRIYFQFVVDTEMHEFFENKRIDLFEGGTKEYK